MVDSLNRTCSQTRDKQFSRDIPLLSDAIHVPHTQQLNLFESFPSHPLSVEVFLPVDRR